MNAGELAELLARALPDEGLSEQDVERCCYGPGSHLLGDRDGAAVWALRTFDDVTVAWLLVVAVPPDRRRRGRAEELVQATAARARDAGAVDLHLGNATPRYLWPGVDFSNVPALCLFEATGFEPYGAACNMSITTDFRAPVPDGLRIGRETGAGAADLARREFPHWEDEVTRATAVGTCFVASEGTDTIAFACHSANRDGWIGPMATDPERRRSGTGHALLSVLCRDLGDRGHAAGEIAWVGPIGFYAKAGARVSRVFRNARRSL
jgi:GNAT superfamily N-acetyltransferase